MQVVDVTGPKLLKERGKETEREREREREKRLVKEVYQGAHA